MPQSVVEYKSMAGIIQYRDVSVSHANQHNQEKEYLTETLFCPFHLSDKVYVGRNQQQPILVSELFHIRLSGD